MGGSLRGLRERPALSLGTCLSEDVELRQLLEGVAEAGSWAVWMKLLVAGGLTFKRARIVTGKISAVITECRCAVAKVRHERAVMEGVEAAKRRQEQLSSCARPQAPVLSRHQRHEVFGGLGHSVAVPSGEYAP
jgi:hypothetical protein